MLRAPLAISIVPLALVALTGCATDPPVKEAGFAIPAGVQKQYEVLSEEVSEKGKTVKSGEWTVNLITEAAEPWFDKHAEYFRAPQAGETHHIEIIPTETSTGRIVPSVPITLEVINSEQQVVQKLPLDFYYSTFYHYANNFTVSEEGTYTLRATLGVPEFNRHGEESEHPALSEGASVEFSDVKLAKD